MDINEVVSKMGYVNDLINSGRFDSAYENVKEILGNINNINTINSNFLPKFDLLQSKYVAYSL